MVDATIQTGDKLQLNFDVENRGTRHGSQTVELLLDDTVVDEAAAVLDSTETGQLVLETDAFSDDDEGQVFVVETVIGTRTEATFEVEVVDFPDYLSNQYHSEKEDLDEKTNMTDRANESDLIGSFSIVEDGINGNKSYRFDGSQTAENDNIELTKGNFAIVMSFDFRGDRDENQTIFEQSTGEAQNNLLAYHSDDLYYLYRGGTSGQLEGGGPIPSEPYVLTAIFWDNGEAEVRENQTTVLGPETTGSGDSDLNGFRIAGDSFGSSIEADFIKVETIEDFDTIEEVEDREQHIAEVSDINMS